MKKLLITLLLFFGVYNYVSADTLVKGNDTGLHAYDSISCYNGDRYYIRINNNYSGYYNTSHDLTIKIYSHTGALLYDKQLKDGSYKKYDYLKAFQYNNVNGAVYLFSNNASYGSAYSNYYIILFLDKENCEWKEITSGSYGNSYNENVELHYNQLELDIPGDHYIYNIDTATFETGSIVSDTNVNMPALDYNQGVRTYKAWGLGVSHYFYKNSDDIDFYAFDQNDLKLDYKLIEAGTGFTLNDFWLQNNYENNVYPQLMQLNNHFLKFGWDNNSTYVYSEYDENNNLVLTYTGYYMGAVEGSDGTIYLLNDQKDKIISYYNQDNIYLYDTNSGSINFDDFLYTQHIGYTNYNNYISYSTGGEIYLNTDEQDLIVEDPNEVDDGNDGGDSGTGSDDGYFSWIGNPFEGLFDKATNIGDTDDTIGKTKAIGSGYINLGNSIGEIGQEVENHDLDINYDTGGISSEGTQLIDSLTLKKDKVEGSFLYTAYLIMKIFAIVVIIIIIIVIILSLI